MNDWFINYALFINFCFDAVRLKVGTRTWFFENSTTNHQRSNSPDIFSWCTEDTRHSLSTSAMAI